MGRFARSRAPMFRDVVDVNAAVSETRAYLAAGPVRKVRSRESGLVTVSATP